MDWFQGRSEIKNILQLQVINEDFKEKYYQELIKNSELKDKIIQLQDDLLTKITQNSSKS
jgi:hypothetical protein